MASFKDVEEAFIKNETSDFRCIAMVGREPSKVRCDKRLEAAKKEELAGLLPTDRAQLHLNEIRQIIWRLLCTYHGAKERQCAFEKRVEESWREEFQDIDFTPRRSPSRRSGLSEPSTPTPTPQRSSRNGSFQQASLSPSRTTALNHDRTIESGACSQSQSASSLDLENVVDSIETTSGVRESFDVIASPTRPEERNEPLEQEGVDFENDIIDQRWGDSSVAVGGEASSRRQLHIYRLETGEVEKHVSEQGTILEEPTQSRSGHVDGQGVVTPQSGESASCEAESSARSNDRLSLSPEQRGRRASSFAKSDVRSRGSRSPSTPAVTDRAKLAFASMVGDAMYDRPPQNNEENVIQLLQKPLSKTEQQSFTKQGWVYAIRDPELDLVKIGLTAERKTKVNQRIPVDNRLKEHQGKCKLSASAYIIEDVDNEISVPIFKRLEDLILEDLRPHRWYYECACGLRNQGLYTREHHEWYEITDEVAIKTINLWRNFLLLNPYGNLQHGQHPLNDRWLQRLKCRSKLDEHEKHEHHQQRLERWRSLLQDQSPTVTINATLATSPTAATGQATGEAPGFKAEDPETPRTSLKDIPPYEPGEACVASSDSKPRIDLNGEHFSLPTTPGLSTASVSRSSSIGVGRLRRLLNFASAAPLHQTSDTIPQSISLPENVASETTATQRTSGIDVHDFAESKFGLVNLLSAIDAFLREERKALSPRNAYNDLHAFKWPISTAVILALCSFYVPPLLSAFMWILFLPCFVAELREW